MKSTPVTTDVWVVIGGSCSWFGQTRSCRTLASCKLGPPPRSGERDRGDYDRWVTGAYPAHREADVVLRDGSTVHVRPVRPSDEPALVEFFGALSPESRGFRFFTAGASLEGAARLTVDVDYESRYGMVAARGDGDHLVGQGTYVATGPGRAEIAFAISDELTGQGVGTIMLAHLAEVATEHDISLFEAEVQPDNRRMVEVFRESGFPVEISSVPGAILSSFPPCSPPRGWSALNSEIGSPPPPRCAASSSRARSRLSVPRAGAAASVARSSTTCWSPASAASFIRSIPRRRWSNRFAPIRASAMFPARSTLR